MKQRTGSVFKRNGAWYARVTFTDGDSGERVDIKRKARSMSHAHRIRRELLDEIDRAARRAEAMRDCTFDQLAEYYAEHYLIEAQYVDGRKVAGLRSARTLKQQVAVLRAHFGPRRIREITYGDLRSFRAARLSTPVKPKSEGGKSRQRSIATVNREMALLRRLLNVAQREGWIAQNPFGRGESLISAADEKQRQRILTKDEERRLLDLCTPPFRQHLRPILICALDTGMRQGEILKLRWCDVDLDERTIHIRAFNTKTMRERNVAMTSRLHAELLRLWLKAGRDRDALVFSVQNNVKRAFAWVRDKAGIPDLRFHDLRHTAATRLARGNLSIPEVGRILGHSEPRTTYRYTNADAETAKRAAAILDDLDAEVALRDAR